MSDEMPDKMWADHRPGVALQYRGFDHDFNGQCTEYIRNPYGDEGVVVERSWLEWSSESDKARSKEYHDNLAALEAKLAEAEKELKKLQPVVDWLELNGETENIVEFLQSTNDNPNIKSLPDDYQAETRK